MRALASLLLLLLPLQACGGDSTGMVWARGEAVAQLVAEQARAVPPGTALSLRDLAPFRWERLYLLPPDGPAPALRDSLGASWPAIAGAVPANRAGAPLLVFQAGGDIVAAAALPADAAALAPELLGRGYAPAEAAFRVARESGTPPRLER